MTAQPQPPATPPVPIAADRKTADDDATTEPASDTPTEVKAPQRSVTELLRRVLSNVLTIAVAIAVIRTVLTGRIRSDGKN